MKTIQENMSNDANEFWNLKTAVNKQDITVIAFLAKNSLCSYDSITYIGLKSDLLVQ